MDHETRHEEPMAEPPSRPLRTHGAQIVNGRREPVRLKAVNVGRLNMENFVTGYAATRR